MTRPDRNIGGPVRIKKFLAHVFLAGALAAGCTPAKTPEVPLKGNKSVSYSQIIERDCKDLGILPGARETKVEEIAGLKLRTYAADRNNFYVTASGSADLLRRQEITFDYNAIPGVKDVNVEMNLENSPRGVIYSGAVTIGRDTAPTPWTFNGRAIPTGPDVCVVATTKVDQGKIDQSQTKVYTINSTPAVGA